MPRHNKVYADSVIDEAIALYESGEPIAEINKAFDLEKTTIYHFLKRRGITPRSKQDQLNGTIKRKEATDLVVTTDKEGWVVGLENRAAKKTLFLIDISGTLEVEADTMEEALANARKRLFVGRIHSVREK